MMSYEGATYLCCINIQHTTEWSWKAFFGGIYGDNEMHERIWLWMRISCAEYYQGGDLMCHFLSTKITGVSDG